MYFTTLRPGIRMAPCSNNGKTCALNVPAEGIMINKKPEDITPTGNPTLTKSEIFNLRRTIMSAEGSLKGWMSMGISMISFGFGIHEILMSLPSEVVKRDPAVISLFLISMGTIIIVYGAADYWLTIRWLHQDYGAHFNKVLMLFSLIMAIFGVIAFFRIVARII